jgi:hypothetical protein
MIPTSILERTAFAAEHQAKAALRAGRRGNADAFAVAQNRMYDVLESSQYPVLATAALVQILGRSKAMVLKIEKPIINNALGDGAPVLARHYQPVGPLLNLAA